MAVTKVPPTKIDHFFAASSARLDRWRDLNESAHYARLERFATLYP